MVRAHVDLCFVSSALGFTSTVHTLDAQQGGVNDWLLEAFGPCTDVLPIQATEGQTHTGQGRTATLPAPPLGELSNMLKKHLDVPHVHRVGDHTKPIHRVAVCPGAGGDQET